MRSAGKSDRNWPQCATVPENEGAAIALLRRVRAKMQHLDTPVSKCVFTEDLKLHVVRDETLLGVLSRLRYGLQADNREAFAHADPLIEEVPGRQPIFALGLEQIDRQST